MSAASAWTIVASAEGGVISSPSELTTADDENVVVFDGTLHNRHELERALDLQRDSARDGELVLAACRRWGERVAAHLKGTFSLVVWNRDQRRLQAVRDQLGVHALFLHGTSGAVVFANSLTSLMGHPQVRARVNAAALAGLLANRMPYQPETFFTGVERVPQAHSWQQTNGATTLTRYWDPSPAGESLRWADDDEVAQFDALLEQAVSRRMDGGVGIHLSGGLDSVTIAAYATDLARGTGTKPLALSLVFPREDVNEEDVQRSVAEQLGLPLILTPMDEVVRPRGVLAAGIALAAEWPSPLLNPWLPGYLRLNEEAVAQGRSTILTGGGGDEWLTAGPFYSADLIRERRFRELLAFMGVYQRSYPQSRARLVSTLLWKFGARALIAEALGPLLEQHARPLAHARLRRILPSWLAPDASLRDALYARPSRPPRRGVGMYEREGRSALDHPVVDLEMEESFEAGLRSGVRLLQPFWDPDLLQLLYRVPPTVLNRGGWAKGLVRDTLDQRFPNLGFRTQRKVVGTQYFIDLSLQEGAAVRRCLGPVTALADLGVVDRDRIEAYLDGVISAQRRWHARWIWSILSLEVWARSWA